MQVFKLCGRVMWKNKTTIIIYLLIFLFIALLVASAFTNEPSYSGYSTQKTDLAFFAEEDTPLVAGLREALAENANFVEVKDTDSARADALYYRDVNYIVRVPKGFTADFMAGKDPQLETTSVAGSFTGAYIGAKLDRWLTTASLYVKTGAEADPAALSRRISADMKQHATVNMVQTETANTDQQPFLTYYFNFLAYILNAVLISIIAIIMQVFNDRDLRRRTFCSPITPGSYNAQFLLSIAAFSVGAWLLMLLAGALFDREHFFQSATLYLALNSFAFTLTAAALGFFVGSITTSREAVGALSNVLALGPSFIAGVFIPQRFLGEGVLTAARFTPTYWYVKVNTAITTAVDLEKVNFGPVWSALAVVLCFGAAFLALGLVLGKRRRTAE